MRRRVRPTRVAPIQMLTMQTAGGQWIAVMRLDTSEQKDLALRVLNSHADNMMVDAQNAAASSVNGAPENTIVSSRVHAPPAVAPVGTSATVCTPPSLSDIFFS